jgi:hypothetical protein
VPRPQRPPRRPAPDLASPLGEPAVELARWQRRALTTLLETGELAWQGPGGTGRRHASLTGPEQRGPAHRTVRRFMEWLERGGAVAWDPYRRVFWLRDPQAVTRLLRLNEKRTLTAAYRAGRVASAGQDTPHAGHESRSAPVDGRLHMTDGWTWSGHGPPPGVRLTAAADRT